METQIINISLPQKLLALADKLANQEFRSRSELFREAIRTYILREIRLQEVFSYGRKQAKKLKVKEEDLEKLVNDYRQNR